MRSLKKQYDGKVELSVRSIKEPGGEALGKEHFPDQKHGLLAYDSAGEIVDKIEGHRFEAKDIIKVVDKLIE